MARDTDRIKEKLDIVEFLKGYIDLKPAGKNWKALCPFHGDKDPSLMVSSDRQMWHCFGCGLGGDIIKFVMLYENMEFPEALRLLAEKAGIDIGEVASRDQKQFEILYDINTAARDFFQKELSTQKNVQTYLEKRGLKKETIDEFGIGFAPGGDAVTIHLIHEKKFRIDDVIKAGISFKDKNGLYRDRFQRRIMFPIENDLGKTVAFTGRASDAATEDTPKYLNSPESQVFKKSKVLYGLSKSKPFILKQRTAFLVEGQMDLIMAWQAGIQYVVAISGTGLTSDHVAKLRRMADTILVSFDNDAAGRRALERSLDIFGAFDFSIKAVSLGEYKDPAEAAHADPEFLSRAVTAAQPVLEYLIHAYFSSGKINGIAARKAAVRHLLEQIGKLQSEIEQDMWLSELARVAQVSEQSLRHELEEVRTRKGRHTITEETDTPKAPATRIDRILRRLFLFGYYDPALLARLKEHEALIPEAYRDFLGDGTGEKSDQRTLLEMEAGYRISDLDNEAIEQEFSDLIRQLTIEALQQQQRDIREVMRTTHDEEQRTELTKTFDALAKKLDTFKNT